MYCIYFVLIMDWDMVIFCKKRDDHSSPCVLPGKEKITRSIRMERVAEKSRATIEFELRRQSVEAAPADCLWAARAGIFGELPHV